MPRPKSTSNAITTNHAPRHVPLSEEIAATGPLRNKSGKRKSRGDDDGDEEEKFVDSKASRKILRIGQELADEDQTEHRSQNAQTTAFAFESRFGVDEELEDDGAQDDGEAWGDEDEIVEEHELDPEDLDTFNRLLPSSEDPSIGQSGDQTESRSGGTNLAELILEKIALHEAAQAHHRTGPDASSRADHPPLPDKVIEVYTKTGLLLSRYKSGKLPKPFKILPTLPNWPELLSLTQPDAWTPNACYEATRIFGSGKPHMTQLFLSDFILPRVRDDIHETKKLNVHLYKALKRALYKPAAFFKGFLFPLVGSGTCTLREAHIISSVLARVSIPVLHSAAALLRLCDMAAEQSSMATEGGGATNVFIRVLLEKKYALPYKVIDALVFHFLRFREPTNSLATTINNNHSSSNTASHHQRQQQEQQHTQPHSESSSSAHKLPVLWHQCLLAFAQRYRNDITEDQREALLDLIQAKGHAAIGPEVRRELLEGRGRGVLATEPEAGVGVGDGGDDTMFVDEVSWGG